MLIGTIEYVLDWVLFEVGDVLLVVLGAIDGDTTDVGIKFIFMFSVLLWAFRVGVTVSEADGVDDSIIVDETCSAGVIVGLSILSPDHGNILVIEITTTVKKVVILVVII
ncbi:MAG: hypothetical protein PHS54_03290 [Clostridia bacterium]|nr:hypothetical protein [Clostridia bacterium]